MLQRHTKIVIIIVIIGSVHFPFCKFIIPFVCTGITLLQGFGFVQFDKEEEAVRAVQVENGSDLKGNKIGGCFVKFFCISEKMGT